jgi:hypothetical protein
MTGMSSAQSTLNRSSKNRLGLLLKQYYDDPALSMGSSDVAASAAEEYSLPRLEKLKTESLIAKAVESLRSYKEAESDLRMLLHNNCDKLLKGVHVVCDIRQGSREVDESGLDLERVFSNIQLNESEEIQKYTTLQARQTTIDMIKQLERFPSDVLMSTTATVEQKIRLYLEIREEIFLPLSSKYLFISKIFETSRQIVEDELVPRLVSENETDGKTRVALLMDLFPRGHSKHGEVMQQYVELEIAQLDAKLSDTINRSWSFSESLTCLKSAVETLFVCREFDDANLVLDEKLSSDLLPRASALVVRSVGTLNGIEETMENIQAAAAVHLRIPRLSRNFLIDFSKSAIFSWIKAQFKTAARVCVEEYLPPLLASSSFGPCCDVIHTRCCTVIAQSKEFIVSAIDRSDDLGLAVEIDDDMFGVEAIMTDVVEYYEGICVTNTVELEVLIKMLKLFKFLQTRRTLERTLNAVGDVFQVTTKHPENKVIGKASHDILKLIGEWVGADESRLGNAIKDGGGLVTVLDPISSSQKLVGGLPGTSQGIPPLDVGTFIVCAFHYKAKREEIKQMKEEARNVLNDSNERTLPDWIERLVGGPSSEFALTLNAMIDEKTQSNNVY